jgi:hypothetical protein
MCLHRIKVIQMPVVYLNTAVRAKGFFLNSESVETTNPIASKLRNCSNEY